MKLILASTLSKSSDKLAPLLKEANIRAILCIPTAVNVYTPPNPSWHIEELNTLRRLGVELDIFDLAGKSTEQVQAKLATHITVYVTGGNTYYLLEQMRLSGFDKVIHSWAGVNKTYIGSSAGAAVACPRIDYIGQMDDPSKADLTDFTGLNLYPNLIMAHMDHPKYGSMSKVLMAEWQTKGFSVTPINEDELIVWETSEIKV